MKVYHFSFAPFFALFIFLHFISISLTLEFFNIYFKFCYILMIFAIIFYDILSNNIDLSTRKIAQQFFYATLFFVIEKITFPYNKKIHEKSRTDMPTSLSVDYYIIQILYIIPTQTIYFSTAKKNRLHWPSPSAQTIRCLNPYTSDSVYIFGQPK